MKKTISIKKHERLMREMQKAVKGFEDLLDSATDEVQFWRDKASKWWDIAENRYFTITKLERKLSNDDRS